MGGCERRTHRAGAGLSQRDDLRRSALRARPKEPAARSPPPVPIGERLRPGPQPRVAVKPLEEGDRPDEEIPAGEAESDIVEVLGEGVRGKDR